MRAGLASSTRAVYCNALNQFRIFRDSYKLGQSWPVPVEQVEAFIAYNFNNGYAYSTANTFVCAIRFNHKLLGLPDTASTFTIKKILEGYRRSKPTHDTRMPITYDILHSICIRLESVCTCNYECHLFRAAFTLAFFGLFRVSELVFTSEQLADAPLFVQDIIGALPASPFQVRLRRSKTNQQGPPILVPIAAIGTPACPVASMNAYLQIRSQSHASRYLFLHSDGSPLTRYQFGAVLTKAIRSTNIDAAGFKSHSFRIGAATWLAKKGVAYNVIQRMGRWSSDTFRRYIRL